MSNTQSKKYYQRLTEQAIQRLWSGVSDDPLYGKGWKHIHSCPALSGVTKRDEDWTYLRILMCQLSDDHYFCTSNRKFDSIRSKRGQQQARAMWLTWLGMIADEWSTK